MLLISNWIKENLGGIHFLKARLTALTALEAVIENESLHFFIYKIDPLMCEKRLSPMHVSLLGI
jgi:hypothetical protein